MFLIEMVVSACLMRGEPAPPPRPAPAMPEGVPLEERLRATHPQLAEQIKKQRQFFATKPEHPPEPDPIDAAILARPTALVPTSVCERVLTWLNAKQMGPGPLAQAVPGPEMRVAAASVELTNADETALPVIGRPFADRRLWRMRCQVECDVPRAQANVGDPPTDLRRKAILTVIVDPADGAPVMFVLERREVEGQTLRALSGSALRADIWANGCEAWHALVTTAPPIGLFDAMRVCLSAVGQTEVRADAVVAYCVESSRMLGQFTLASGDGPRQPVWCVQFRGQPVTGPLPEGANPATKEVMWHRVSAVSGKHYTAISTFSVPDNAIQPK